MRKKLVKIGNDRAIIIENSILQILDITDETELIIIVQNGAIIITPINGTRFLVEDNDTKFDLIVDQVLQEYTPVLKKLAKN